MTISATWSEMVAGFTVAEDLPRVRKRFTDGAEVVLSIVERRSHARMGFYWSVLKWSSENVPEHLQDWRFGPRVWHEWFKDRYGLTSVRFDKLTEREFSAYVDFVVEEIARVWGVPPFEIIRAAGAA